METICKNELCTGCQACVNICPHNAINMQEDVYGFLYPTINSNACTNCNLCAKTCPVNNEVKFRFPQKVYAAYNSTFSIRDASATGGVGASLMSFILGEGGVVYGCSQKNIDYIRHIKVEEVDCVKQLRDSKYAQSDIGYSYRQMKDDLKNGRTVLFIGTPCQVAGAKTFLKNDDNNLYLVDICCHGVPSHKLLIDNVQLIKKKKGIKISNERLNVTFRKKYREKSKTEFGFYLRETIKDGNGLSYRELYSKTNHQDYFIYGFQNGMFDRECCYTCRFAQGNRCSDITIADFWGLGYSDNPEMNENKGVNAVLLNTRHGIELFDKVKSSLTIEERPVEEAIKGNGQLNHPIHMPPQHTVFLNLYPKIGFEKACQQSFGKQIRNQQIKDVIGPCSSLFTYLYRKINSICSNKK